MARALLTLVVLLAACTNPGGIVARPTPLDFGVAEVGEERVARLWLENHDVRAVTVEVVVAEGRDVFRIEREAGFEIEAGRAVSVPILAEGAERAVFSGAVSLSWSGGESTVPLVLTVGPVEIDGDRDGAALGSDCDDADPTVHPGVTEVCDGRDEDCSGVADDALDADGDGVGSCIDCDDSDPLRAPGLVELCDGRDGDCDGDLGEDELDQDGDLALSCGGTFVDVGLGFQGGDCDDADEGRFPGAGERCNGIDDDCDGDLSSVEGDEDGDLYLVCLGFEEAGSGALGGGDCVEGDSSIFPGAPEICDDIDQDCDGATDDAASDGDGDGVAACDGDCDDTNVAAFPGAPELCGGVDEDCDGAVPGDELDLDLDGVAPCAGDCDDADPNRAGGQPESCDGIDNDCDGAPDPLELDVDLDGVRLCAGDCDDGAATTFPGAAELCDGLDQDCDALIPADESDADADGQSTCGGDCNDGDAAVYVGQTDICDGVDADCAGNLFLEADADNDGVRICGGDCNDQDGTRYPGAPELCDTQDNDCDTVVDEGLDADNDGYTSCGGDCGEGMAQVHPLALEICDGLDNDCDGFLSLGETDADADGASVCDGDCDDNNAAVGASAPEVCNTLDDDCDTLVDEGIDADGDGASACGVDCDDNAGLTYPGAVEVCDGADNNCDFLLPVGEVDGDFDGLSPCEGDCDDLDATVALGFAELCDTVDNDCDSVVDDGFDADGDGAFDDAVPACASAWGAAADCDDGDTAIHPGAAEGCDGADTDCDGVLPADEADADADGQRICDGDCDDAAPGVLAGAPEFCDTIDNDCDLAIDEDFDADDDLAPDAAIGDCQAAWGALADCDDADAAVHPGAAESCNGIDDDCDAVIPTNEGDGDGDGDAPCDGDCDDANADVGPNQSEIACNVVDDDCDGVVDPGDTHPEVIVKGQATNTALLWNSDGAGGFSAVTTLDPPGLGNVWGTLAADFDGDFDLDVMVERSPSWPTSVDVHLYRSDCRGGLTEQSVGGSGGIALSNLSADIHLASDVDLDGDVDVLGWDWTDGEGYTWLNAGNGSSWSRLPATTGTRPFDLTYWSPDTLTGRESVATPMIDVTLDLYPDIVECSNAATTSTTCRVHTGDGDGTFTLGATWTINALANGIAIADFDGDGDVDLIAGLDDDGDAGQAWIWHGSAGVPLTPSGAGTPVLDVYAGDGPNSDAPGYGWMAPYDFDGDGDVDIIASYHQPFATTTRTVAFLENDGNANFTSTSIGSVPHQWGSGYLYSPDMIGVPVYP